MRRIVTRSALCLAMSACFFQAALAQDGPIYVQVGGGDWADANIKAYVEPFEKETGIKIVPVRDFLSTSKLKLMIMSNNIEVDVGMQPGIDMFSAAREGYLEEIDYSVFDKENLEGLGEAGTKPHAVASLYSAIVLAQNDDDVGAQGPANWSDFWDVEKFPGTRSLRGGWYGSGPWEEALVADGVPKDQLYPIDFDRAFASLDKIRPHITKWWKEGAEGQQLLADGTVSISGVYSARAEQLALNGAPISYTWEGAKAQIDYWVIPKGAKNPDAALKFIEFATRAERQAEFVNMYRYGPSNSNAYKYIQPEITKLLPNNPENADKLIIRNDEWYAAENPDGETNLQKAVARWNEWITE